MAEERQAEWRAAGRPRASTGPSVPRGRAFMDLNISCGICGLEESMGEENHRAGLQVARDKGWVRTRRYGWICPEDADRLGIGPRGVRPKRRQGPKTANIPKTSPPKAD